MREDGPTRVLQEKTKLCNQLMGRDLKQLVEVSKDPKLVQLVVPKDRTTVDSKLLAVVTDKVRVTQEVMRPLILSMEEVRHHRTKQHRLL